MPYGVDAAAFVRDDDARARGRALLGVAADVPLVVAAGRFVRKKGFEYLIDAVPALVARHPSVQVVIAGDGDLDADLRRRARDAGVTDHVRFLGLLSHESVPLALAAADVAVVPSVRDDSGNVDGLPNVVLEALASGTPVVATPAGGIGAAITDGENGLARAGAGRRRPRRRHRSRARRIGALGAALGAQARRRVQSDHGWPGVARAFEAAYASASSQS